MTSPSLYLAHKLSLALLLSLWNLRIHHLRTRHIQAAVVDHLGPAEQNWSSLPSRGVGRHQLVKMVSPLAPLPRVDLLHSEEAHLPPAMLAQVGGRERNQGRRLILPPAPMMMTMMTLMMI